VTGNYTDYVPGTIKDNPSYPVQDASNYFDTPAYAPLVNDPGGADAGPVCGALYASNGSTLRGKNLAYGKPTTSFCFGQPQLGNDGFGFGFSVASYTGATPGLYWQVDLGAAHNLIEIDYLPDPTTNTNLSSRQNVRVDVGNDPTFATYTTVGTVDANGIPNYAIAIYDIAPPVNARYVRLSKIPLPDAGAQTFSVAEVMVYGP